MGLEMLLLESGIAFGAALLCGAVYQGITSHSKTNRSVVQSIQASPEVVPQQIAPRLQELPVTETQVITEVSPVQLSTVPTMSAPLVEAPPPFEEPETAFTRTEISSTPLPTDVNAVANFASPVENATPALVIARPKRTRKTTPNGTRRKRAPRVKQTLPTPETLIAPVQQDEIPQP